MKSGLTEIVEVGIRNGQINNNLSQRETLKSNDEMN